MRFTEFTQQLTEGVYLGGFTTAYLQKIASGAPGKWPCTPAEAKAELALRAKTQDPHSMESASQGCSFCGSKDHTALDEAGKASKELCQSSRPDADLGASNLASCKSQGLRARDGDKSHKLGKGPESRVKMGGHKIKGKKYGGPLPDWGSNK